MAACPTGKTSQRRWSVLPAQAGDMIISVSISDDIVLHGYQGVEPGLESVKQFYNGFWAIFPDARVTVQELLEQGETLVARYVITGTQHHAFRGVAAAGQRIELPGISILHFRGGQCFERWACSDSLILLSQIGATIPH
jgi:predicted ester cyclase